MRIRLCSSVRKRIRRLTQNDIDIRTYFLNHNMICIFIDTRIQGDPFIQENPFI